MSFKLLIVLLFGGWRTRTGLSKLINWLTIWRPEDEGNLNRVFTVNLLIAYLADKDRLERAFIVDLLMREDEDKLGRVFIFD